MNGIGSMLTNVGTGAATGAATGAVGGFGIGAVPGAIVGAAIPIVTTIIEGILNNQETDKVNAQNLKLYEQDRSDRLKSEKQQQKNFEKQYEANREDTAFNRSQTLYQNKVGKEQTFFNRQQNFYDLAVKRLSNQFGNLQAKTAPFTKR